MMNGSYPALHRRRIPALQQHRRRERVNAYGRMNIAPPGVDVHVFQTPGLKWYEVSAAVSCASLTESLL